MKTVNTDARKFAFKLGLISILTCCLLSAAAQVTTQSTADKALSAFDDFYKESLQKHKIIGGTFMLIHDNQVIDRQFYGMYDLENKRAVDENTIYHWASITKTFTGIAIMQLRDRGLLKLDDPIINYIPELRQVHDPYGDISEITIQQLMSHTAGFRGATWPWGGDKDWHPFESQKWGSARESGEVPNWRGFQDFGPLLVTGSKVAFERRYTPQSQLRTFTARTAMPVPAATPASAFFAPGSPCAKP